MQVLCEHRHHADGLEEQWFNEYCDMPRIPYHMYSLHGGAGALMSIGLMKRIKWEDFEACVLSLRSTGGSWPPEASLSSKWLAPHIVVQIGACLVQLPFDRSDPMLSTASWLSPWSRWGPAVFDTIGSIWLLEACGSGRNPFLLALGAVATACACLQAVPACSSLYSYLPSALDLLGFFTRWPPDCCLTCPPHR